MTPSAASLFPRLAPVLCFATPDWVEVWRALWVLCRDSGLGGILLRRGNADAWRRVAEEARTLGASRPILMADLEQGAASQLGGFPWFPKAFTVGATGAPDCAYRMGEGIGRQARDLGLDMVLAPVADLLFACTGSVIGTRSFGATPTMVGAMVEAFVRGCQSQGIMAAAKHFPGHGRTPEDSHHGLASIQVNREAWLHSDAVPFRMAMKAGVRAVMVGHLWSQDLDPGPPRPASRSPVIMQNLLREEMGFRGLILTDSLEMAGAGGNDLRAAQAAVEAGADLIIGPDLGFGPHASVDVVSRQSAGAEGHADHAWVKGVVEEAVAWVAGMMPAAPCVPASLQIVPDIRGDSSWADDLKGSLHRRGALDTDGARVIAVRGSSGSAQAPEALEGWLALGCETTAVVAFGALDIVRCLRGDVPVCFIGDSTAASQEAVARVLCGEIPAPGRPDFPAYHGEGVL